MYSKSNTHTLLLRQSVGISNLESNVIICHDNEDIHTLTTSDSNNRNIRREPLQYAYKETHTAIFTTRSIAESY